jgi:hypothetical protein
VSHAACGAGLRLVYPSVTLQAAPPRRSLGLCTAAQPLVEAVGARGSDTGVPSRALSDTAALANRAADAELRSALTDLGDTYVDASGDPPGSAAWAGADRAVATLSRVCQRLSAF